MEYEGSFTLNENCTEWWLEHPGDVINNPNAGFIVQTDCRESLVRDIGVANLSLVETLGHSSPIIGIQCWGTDPTQEFIEEFSYWVVGSTDLENVPTVCTKRDQALIFDNNQFTGVPVLSMAAFLLAYCPNFRVLDLDYYVRNIILDWYDGYNFEYASDAVLTAMYLKHKRHFQTNYWAGVGANGPATYLTDMFMWKYYIFEQFFTQYEDIIREIADDYYDRYEDDDDTLVKMLRLTTRR